MKVSALQFAAAVAFNDVAAFEAELWWKMG